MPVVAKLTVKQPDKLATFPSRRPALDVKAMRQAVTPQQISTEESKLLRIEESIRVFVRVADPKFRQVVPMRFFNLLLTAAEADAYSSDYLEEKSVRAGVARVTLRLPEGLKAQVERAASRDGVSINSWLVDAAAHALRLPPSPRRGSRRMTGFVRG